MAEKSSKVKRGFILNQIRLRNYIHNHDKIVGVLLAAFVGIIVALAAIGFRYLIQFTQLYSLGSFSENIYDFVATLKWWHILLSTVSGGFVI
ncbi:MAG: hypothetical protein JKY84_11925, partial [Emcibacteraceae bacterium]|nr:hypothetical protein [Emcibacteraceae bacterium]